MIVDFVVADAQEETKLVVAESATEEGEAADIFRIGFDADFDDGGGPRVDVEVIGDDIGNFNSVDVCAI